MYPSILIVDDEPFILQSLGGLLSDEGYEVITASNGYEALKIIDAQSPDLVVLDIWMPGIDGIETLREIKKNHPFLPVVIITGHGNIETAVTATKLGAFDMIEKPLSIEKVIVTINNALNFKRLEEENRYLRKKTIEKHAISGDSPASQELRKLIAAAAPRDAWVLITGENGTGKELVARTIHYLSPRADQPLVVVNCGALPENLIENELFGQEKGAFDGATARKRGNFERANGGTLFLDEIGDLPLKTQGKILSALEKLEFQRVGGSRTLSVDLRVIAATNKDLAKEIAAGHFREDLYYRLNVIPISITPLRQRPEDIPVLVKIFFQEIATANRSRVKTASPEALTALQRYRWPGNVRELRNLVERLDILVEGDIIQLEDIPATYRGEATETGSPGADFFEAGSLKEASLRFEEAFIQHKVDMESGDIARVAEAIGVSKSYLQKRLKGSEK
ncbi:MAG: sigma-54 dependent transcriptional regulator [Desulfobacterales bacterium]|jgi:two-component system nitrogen regulation response regulator NtrX|nr:sigma-54 dependent transcriptional regulator [Desulfobacteraceae bacterium]MDY0311473.1 sigma-54 dependent transcriptional regulator [Desulfobacterales bacterium]